MALFDIELGKIRNQPKWMLQLGRAGWSFPIDAKQYFKEIEKGLRAKPFWWSFPTKHGEKGQLATDADKFWEKKAKEL